MKNGFAVALFWIFLMGAPLIYVSCKSVSQKSPTFKHESPIATTMGDFLCGRIDKNNYLIFCGWWRNLPQKFQFRQIEIFWAPVWRQTLAR